MRFYNIFFSPTGGTEKVADIVAKGTKLDAEEIDLIKEPDKLMKVKFEKKDLCLVAVPSYGGRIPSVVTDMCLTMKIHFWANMDLRLRDGPFAMQSQQEAMWIVHSLKLYQNLCVSQSCLRS